MHVQLAIQGFVQGDYDSENNGAGQNKSRIEIVVHSEESSRERGEKNASQLWDTWNELPEMPG